MTDQSQGQHRCESCTMPIESGTLCQYCADEEGALRPFPEVFDRMVQWSRRQDEGLSDGEAERRTLEFMASMPAWRAHPEVRARLGDA